MNIPFHIFVEISFALINIHLPHQLTVRGTDYLLCKPTICKSLSLFGPQCSHIQNELNQVIQQILFQTTGGNYHSLHLYLSVLNCCTLMTIPFLMRCHKNKVKKIAVMQSLQSQKVWPERNLHTAAVHLHFHSMDECTTFACVSTCCCLLNGRQPCHPSKKTYFLVYVGFAEEHIKCTNHHNEFSLLQNISRYSSTHFELFKQHFCTLYRAHKY